MSPLLRDQLLAAEAENPAFRDEYERRLQAMIEKPLNLYNRIGFTFGALAALAGGVADEVLAIKLRHASPAAVAGLAIAGALSLAGAFLASRVLIRGKLDRQRDPIVQAGVIWCFCVVLVTAFMVGGGIDSIHGVGLTLFGLVFWLGGAVLLLRTVIEQSELRTQQKLLEVELRLAQIADALGQEKKRE